MYARSRVLLECHIAGNSHYDLLEVCQELQPNIAVDLIMEADNPYDPQAVAIYYRDKKLGYIPRIGNGIISDLLYFGHANILEARMSFNDNDAHSSRRYRIVIKIRDAR